MNNMEKENIPVYMPDADAAKFLLFQEHYDAFCLLVDSGVFNVRNGSVTIHMDNDSSIKAINRLDVLYSHRHVS